MPPSEFAPREMPSGSEAGLPRAADRMLRWFTAVGADGAVIRRNFGWLGADRLFRLVVGLVVNVWLVRYLGALDFGLMSFAQSLVGLFAVFTQLGLDSIIVRDLVRRPAEAPEVLGTACLLRAAGGLLTLTLSVAAVLLLKPGDRTALILGWLFAGSAMFQAFDIIEHWFQSRSSLAAPVLARTCAFVLGSCAKLACLILRAPLEVLAAAVALEAVLAALALAIAYRAAGASWAGWRFRLERGRQLLADAWPLMLGGLAIMLYVRTDQVMLTLMRGARENGIYAAAQRLSEILYFVPSALSVAANPALLRSHQAGGAEYERRLTRLFSVLVWGAFLIALPVSLMAGWITRTLFGTAFAASGPVLALHVWAAPAVFLGVAQSNWFVAHGQQRGLLLRTLVGAVTNIGLNLALIPSFGAMGAAGATRSRSWWPPSC